MSPIRDFRRGGAPRDHTDAVYLSTRTDDDLFEAVHEIIVLSVAQPPEPIDIVEMDAVIDSATRHYEELFNGLHKKAKDKGMEIKTEVAIGHPADQIVKYAAEKKCDMVVVGHRGKSRIEDWLMGSVSKRVTTYAPCTVTIVK